MSLILTQVVSELLLTMCKAYQGFYNQTIYKKKNYRSDMFHKFIKTFLILEVQHTY